MLTNGWLGLISLGLGSGLALRLGLGIGLVLLVSYTVTLDHSVEQAETSPQIWWGSSLGAKALYMPPPKTDFEKRMCGSFIHSINNPYGLANE